MSLRVDGMDKINHLLDKKFLLVIMLSGVVLPVVADQALSSTIDCSEVNINYIDNPEWTHRERLEAMDKAFFESVNRFELCNLSNQSSSSSSGSDSASGANELSGAGGEAGSESVASAEMTGTEIESTMPPADSAEESNMSESETSESVEAKGGSVANGATPEDIPAANNDDVIAAQIRLAAEIEKDPVKKQKLWNEYRKYKGLPVNE